MRVRKSDGDWEQVGGGFNLMVDSTSKVVTGIRAVNATESMAFNCGAQADIPAVIPWPHDGADRARGDVEVR